MYDHSVPLTILAFFVTEVFGDSQTSESDTSTSAWWFVHLTEDQRDLGLAIKVNDTSLLHFVVEIIALACPLAHTSEHGEPTVCLCDVVL